MRKAIFLDRDGVLNKAFLKNGKPIPPNSIKELIILPKVLESLQNFKKNDFLLFVVTNQPDVARKKVKKESILEILPNKLKCVIQLY